MEINPFNFPDRGKLYEFIMERQRFDYAIPQDYFEKMPKDMYSSHVVWAYPYGSIFGEPVNVLDEARKKGHFIACQNLLEHEIPHAIEFIKQHQGVEITRRMIKEYFSEQYSTKPDLFVVCWFFYLEEVGLGWPPMDEEHTTPEPEPHPEQ